LTCGPYHFTRFNTSFFSKVQCGSAFFVAGLIAVQTEKGRTALNFAKEARVETRKVVWPTRQEAIQTTGIVIVATLIMSLILWGLDSLLFELVGFITGLKV
jgi:preprotein translocase subunit SecE